MKRLCKICEIGFLNTLRLNYYYFGLRGVFHPVFLASRNLKIITLKGSVNANDLNTGSIKIGFGNVGIVDKKYKRSLWENSGNITFIGKAFLGPGTKIANSGNLVLGNNVTINANSDIVCRKQVTIEDDTLISWECLIMDTDWHSIFDQDGYCINEDRPITIGANTWIGCRTTVLKGAKIAKGSVIAANSVVTTQLAYEKAVYVDNKVIKKNITWRR